MDAPTFNPWIGCTKVSAACDHCYAEAWDARGLQGQPTRWRPSPAGPDQRELAKPLVRNRKAAAEGPLPVFCASLADVLTIMAQSRRAGAATSGT